MQPSVFFLALLLTGAQAQTVQQDQSFLLRDTPHVVLTDTRCLILTLPGFDPQILTPGQIARMRAIMVDGNPVGVTRHDDNQFPGAGHHALP